PKFAANLNFLFTELPFLDRFEAAAAAGFRAVEATDPYEAPPEEFAQALTANGLSLVLFNIAPGNRAAGERGCAGIPGRERDFQRAFEDALRWADRTGGRQIHLLAGLVHQGAQRCCYIANVKKAARLAAASGVSVLIEPINRRDI